MVQHLIKLIVNQALEALSPTVVGPFQPIVQMEETIELSQLLILIIKIGDYPPEVRFILMKIHMMLDQVPMVLAVKNGDQYQMDSTKFQVLLTLEESKGITCNLNKILEAEQIFRSTKKAKKQHGIQKVVFQ